MNRKWPKWALVLQAAMLIALLLSMPFSTAMFTALCLGSGFCFGWLLYDVTLGEVYSRIAKEALEGWKRQEETTRELAKMRDPADWWKQ